MQRSRILWVFLICVPILLFIWITPEKPAPHWPEIYERFMALRAVWRTFLIIPTFLFARAITDPSAKSPYTSALITGAIAQFVAALIGTGLARALTGPAYADAPILSALLWVGVFCVLYMAIAGALYTSLVKKR